VLNKRERLVGSIPILGPRVVDGVPSASILRSANPVAIVESNLLASLLYILLTNCHVDLNALSKVSYFIISNLKKYYYACIVIVKKDIIFYD
jgi:hypothetical protein